MPELKALVPKSRAGRGKAQYLYKYGAPQLIEAYENRQLSLEAAAFLARLEPKTQRKAVAELTVDKDKITVLPLTEELLLQQQREAQMKAKVIAYDGLNEFQRAFYEHWLRLRRKYGKEYAEGEMWRLAETVIIRLSAPEIDSPRQKTGQG